MPRIPPFVKNKVSKGIVSRSGQITHLNDGEISDLPILSCEFAKWKFGNVYECQVGEGCRYRLPFGYRYFCSQPLKRNSARPVRKPPCLNGEDGGENAE